MDFSDGHWPDYRPGYTDYNTMRVKIYEETAKIYDFAIRKHLQWKHYKPTTSLANMPGFDQEAADDIKQWATDVWVSMTKIPEQE